MVVMTPKKEKFARALASGMPQRHAYVEAGYSTGGVEPTVRPSARDVWAHRLAHNPEIVARVAELNEEAAARAGMTRDAAMAVLWRLCQSEMPHAVAAIRLAAQLQDWFPNDKGDDMDNVKAAAMRRFASMTPAELRAALSRPVTDLIDVSPTEPTE